MNQAPGDVATRVQGFAELVAARRAVAATDAMIAWVGVDDQRARWFATTATALAAVRVRAATPPDDHGGCWVPCPPACRAGSVMAAHDTAMRQVVVRIANAEPQVAQDLLNAHRLVYGTAGLFWVGLFAVRMLADLLTTETRAS